MVDRPEIESGCFSACKADDHPLQSHGPYRFKRKASRTPVRLPSLVFGIYHTNKNVISIANILSYYASVKYLLQKTIQGFFVCCLCQASFRSFPSQNGRCDGGSTRKSFLTPRSDRGMFIFSSRTKKYQSQLRALFRPLKATRSLPDILNSFPAIL